MVAEMNSTTGVPQWRKRLAYEIAVADHDILHVFRGKPNRYDVAEARRALRRKQQTGQHWRRSHARAAPSRFNRRTTMTYERLFDELKQAKAAIATLATTGELPNGQRLDDLSDDDFYAVVSTFAKFFNSVQSVANYLAVLRKQNNA
jgi:hypothetical protein